MSRRAEPRLIGAFVLVALAVLMVGTLALGGGRWLKTPRTYVAYFQESVKGLRIGAPVTFIGVKVGEVREIKLIYGSDDRAFLVPVLLEIDDASLEITGLSAQVRSEMTMLLSRGLRAQLQLESLVTGQLYVSLDLLPDTPGVVAKNDLKIPQVPTIGSPWVKLSKSLQDVTLVVPNLVTRFDALLARSEALLAVVDAERLGQGVNATADMAIGLERATRDLPTLMARAGALLARLEAAAGTGERVLGTLGEQVSGSLVDLERALASIRRASDQLGLIAADNRRGLKEFVDRGLPNLGGLIDDATRMVNELSGAIRDMRQDPSRFLFGNSTREGVRPR